MKVPNTTIFMGDSSRAERHGQTLQGQKGGKKTIFAGSLNQNQDLITQKKQQARKQAMKLVGDVWAADQKVDDDLAMRRENIKMQKQAMGKANGELRRIEEERKALRESSGVAEDSQEEQDLQLLVKYEKYKRNPTEVSISKEEYERLDELKDAPLTEYQQRSLEMFQSGDTYFQEAQEAQEQIRQDSSAIAATRQGMLKSKAMLEAKQAADEIMEAASKEIVGMLIDEAKDHIDQEMQEKVEAAQKKKEEKEEEEERIRKREEKEQQEEELREQIQDSTQGVLVMEDAMDEVQQEIKKLLEEQKLLQEDLKGAAVDSLK